MTGYAEVTLAAVDRVGYGRGHERGGLMQVGELPKKREGSPRSGEVQGTAADLRALLDSPTAILVSAEREGHIRRVEGTGESLEALCPPGRDLVGRSLLDLWAPNAWLVDAFHRAGAGEAVARTGEASGRTFAIQCAPSRDASGSVTGVVVFANDLTGSRGVFDLLDTLDVVLWQGSSSTLETDRLLGGAEHIIGFSRADWMQPGFLEQRLEPSERDSFRETLRSVGADGQERHLVHRLLTASGDAKWFRTTVRSTGRTDEIVALMLDITNRRATDKTLESFDPRLRLVLTQIPAIVWTVDRDLRYTSGLGAALKDLGLATRPLDGVTVPEYLHTDDPDHADVAAHRRALAGEPVSYEAEHRGRAYMTHVEPFRNDAGDVIGVIGVALDITDRRRAEEDRDRLLLAERRARQEAEDAVHLRDEFLSIASHELRTPLTSLHLIVQSLLRGMEQKKPSLTPDSLHLADRQCRRLRSLIEQLLDSTRIQQGKLTLCLEEINLAAVVRENLVRMRADLDESSTKVTLQGDLEAVGRWDGSRIDQLVNNLLSNAAKYGAGKPIVVTIDRPRPGWVRMVIGDEGIGIAAEHLPRIFERFGRGVSVRHYGGLGLGLYIARQIVEAHGGTISAVSELAQGATFTVELPDSLEPEQRGSQ